MATIDVELGEGLSVKVVVTESVVELREELGATQFVEEQAEVDCE